MSKKMRMTLREDGVMRFRVRDLKMRVLAYGINWDYLFPFFALYEECLGILRIIKSTFVFSLIREGAKVG